MEKLKKLGGFILLETRLKINYPDEKDTVVLRWIRADSIIDIEPTPTGRYCWIITGTQRYLISMPAEDLIAQINKDIHITCDPGFDQDRRRRIEDDLRGEYDTKDMQPIATKERESQ